MTDREILNAILDRLEMRAQQWRDSAKEHRYAERDERRILITGAHRSAAQLADGLANGIDADVEWIMALMKAGLRSGAGDTVNPSDVDAVDPSAADSGTPSTREKGI